LKFFKVNGAKKNDFYQPPREARDERSPFFRQHHVKSHNHQPNLGQIPCPNRFSH